MNSCSKICSAGEDGVVEDGVAEDGGILALTFRMDVKGGANDVGEVVSLNPDRSHES